MQALSFSSSLSILKDAGLLIASGNLPDTGKIQSLKTDSRKIEAGDIFLAYKGVSYDSHQAISSAMSQGAGLIIGDDDKSLHKDCGLPYILVSDSRQAWSHLAAFNWGKAHEKIPMYAVTGTNGKTSSAWLAKELLQACGEEAFIIGTMGAFFKGQHFETMHTTPDPDRLFELIDQAIKLGASMVFMEVSSHAIKQGKLGPIKFDGAMFTSFSRDHLDYHSSMEEYFDTKTELFHKYLKPGGRKIFFEPVFQKLEDRVVKNGAESYGDSSDSHWQVSSVDTQLHGSSFKLNYGQESWSLNVPLAGDFIVHNLVGVLALLRPFWAGENIVEACTRLSTVPGRLERIKTSDNQPTVFVDYAHTPDALETCLKTLKPMVEGRLILVFGCGGDRDRGKRPLMAAVATKLADHVIVTSDNPRTEDPKTIISDILEGVEKAELTTLSVEPDRSTAIHQAIFDAGSKDCVLLAGKGHEDYQILGTQRIHFDDREVARMALDQIERSK